MNEFAVAEMNKIREKFISYDFKHPLRRSCMVAFRDIFDPYCAEYNDINNEERISILKELLSKGVNIFVLYKAFVGMFNEDRPDIANSAGDGLAILLEYAIQNNETEAV